MNGTNIEKIAALASISKFNNPTNFNSEEFQATHLMRKGSANNNPAYKDSNMRGGGMKSEMNPISPTSTKSLIESETVPSDIQNKSKLSSKGGMLSMTMKSKDGNNMKNSGTIEGSKSFSSNTKTEKSMNSIIDAKTLVPKKK